MGLIVPPFYFADQVDNLPATPTTSGTLGTNFTAAANNADGTAVSILSALAFDVHYLEIFIYGLELNSTLTAALVDILIDPAGGTSWASFIDDLVAGQSSASLSSGEGSFYFFPIFIKAGSSLGVRARTSHTVDITAPRIVINAYGNPNRPEQWWCGQKVESLGITAASSAGTSVTPGNSGSFGSWTSIGSVTTGRYGAIQAGLNGTDGNMTAIGYYFQIGYSSVKLPGSPSLYAVGSISERYAGKIWGRPIFCDIPVGTQMQVRGTASGTAEVHQCALYGVY